MSLRAKILSGYLGLVVVPFLVLASVYVKMAETDRDLAVVRHGYFRLWQDVAQVNAFPLGYELEKDTPDWRRYRPNLDRLYLDQKRRLLEDARRRAREVESILRRRGAPPPLQAVLDGVDAALAHLDSYQGDQEVLGQAVERRDFAAADALVPPLRQRRADLSRAIDQLGKDLQDLVEDGLDASRAAHADATRVAGMLAGLSVAFGALMMTLAHFTLKPVDRLALGVEQVARGEFDLRLDIRTGDEIGRLAARFEEMARSLKARDDDLRLTIVDLDRLRLHHERIIRSMGQALVVWDPGGRVVTVNPAAEELFGAGAEALPEALREAADRAAREHGSERVLGLDHLRPADGAPRILDAALVPLRGDDGSHRGVILIADDATLAARAKERVIQAERLAAIGRMSAQVTHEIRNPLNALALNVEMLEDEVASLLAPGSGEARGILTSVRREIDRLNEVAETYLTLARLPSPNLQPEDLGELAASLVGFHRHEWEAKGAKVDLQVAPGLPPVLADAGQLRQALLNLVRNAAEALEPGAGGAVGVSVDGPRAGTVRVTVADDGPGIEPERLARIFDPFYSTKASGTGLGLPITHQIVMEHGGTIRCDSEPGRGTTFTVDLPVAG